jgi:hypothetical protein
MLPEQFPAGALPLVTGFVLPNPSS